MMAIIILYNEFRVQIYVSVEPHMNIAKEAILSFIEKPRKMLVVYGSLLSGTSPLLTQCKIGHYMMTYLTSEFINKRAHKYKRYKLTSSPIHLPHSHRVVHPQPSLKQHTHHSDK